MIKLAPLESVKGRHVHVRVFADPDQDHLAYTGTLYMLPDEFHELQSAIGEEHGRQ